MARQQLNQVTTSGHVGIACSEKHGQIYIIRMHESFENVRHVVRDH